MPTRRRDEALLTRGLVAPGTLTTGGTSAVGRRCVGSRRVASRYVRPLLAYLSSGTIGLRVRETALRPGLATVSGLEGVHPTARVAASPPAPYPLAGDLRLGAVWLSDAWHRVSDIEQRYDFGCGELHTH